MMNSGIVAPCWPRIGSSSFGFAQFNFVLNYILRLGFDCENKEVNQLLFPSQIGARQSERKL